MGHVLRINTKQITYCEGSGNYAYIHTLNDEKYLICKTLKSLSSQLGGEFLRVHKGFLVNSSHIASRNKYQGCLEMRCGQTIPISKRKLKDFFNGTGKVLEAVSQNALKVQPIAMDTSHQRVCQE